MLYSSLCTLMVLTIVGVTSCPKDCRCGLDVKGRPEVTCGQGGMHGAIPVNEMDPHMEVLSIVGLEGLKNSLTMSPVFQRFQKLEEVHIVRSNITSIGRHTFWGVPSLRILNLTDNNILQVVDSNFRGLVNLEELILDRNLVQSLNSGTFQHLSELRTLSLSANRLAFLSPRVFLKLGKLQLLDLSYNRLGHLDPQLFIDVQELRTFSCRSCDLKNMNPHIYSLLPSLAHLDLGENQFMYLDKEEFRDLRKVVSLKLDGNHFPVVVDGTFQSQGMLQHLNLARSHIAKITNHALDNLTSLLELDLSYNKLYSLEPMTFQPLGNNLRYLLVSGNNIRVEEFTYVLQVLPKLQTLGLAEIDMRGGLPLGLLVSLAGLKHLNLSYNALKRFPGQILAPVSSLLSLDLSGNDLYYLDDRTMARIASLKMVYLHENPWACDLCHILAMLKYAVNSSWISQARCALPYRLSGRSLPSLAIEELNPCVSEKDQTEELSGLSMNSQTQLGLIAGGSAVAILLITMAAAVVGILYNRHPGVLYYPKGKKEVEEAYNGDETSIATIDKLKKEVELSGFGTS